MVTIPAALLIVLLIFALIGIASIVLIIGSVLKMAKIDEIDKDI